MVKIKYKSTLTFLIFGILLISSVSAIDIQVWQGKYLTGKPMTWYHFNFTVYDDILVGTPCWSSIVDARTNSDRWWYIERLGVLEACNDPSINYYLNININGADQPPRRILKQLKYADTSVDTNFTQSVNVLGNLTLAGTLYGVNPLSIGDSLNVSGSVTAPYFIGNGSQLKGLTASQIVGGVLNSSQIDDIYLFNTGDNASGNYNFDSNVNVTGNFTVDGNTFFVDSSTGRVGIGTNNPDPSIKLQVIGQIRASSFRPADGTVGLPSYRFNSDADVGMYLPESNNLGFTIDGTERLRIDSSGRIGINTTSPTHTLNVIGDGNFTGNLYSNNALVLTSIAYNDLTGNPSDRITANSHISWIGDTLNVADDWWNAYGDFMGTTTTNKWCKWDGSQIDCNVEPVTGLWVNSSGNATFITGNVGIGTENPTEKLEVNGQIQQINYCGDTQSLLGDYGGGGALTLYGSAGDINTRITGECEQDTFFSATGGNVGIGTATPSQKLDVIGDVEIGGGASFSDGTDEFIHINSHNQDWYIGVRNLVTASNNDFHIGLTQAQDGIFHIQPDGKIGIGTTSPGAELDVNGKIYGWNVPSDVKLTTATHNGSFVSEQSAHDGYKGMYDWIQTNGCSGYHVCDATELTRYSQIVGEIALEGWYNAGVRQTNDFDLGLSDCYGWMDDSSDVQGNVWEDYPSWKLCSGSYPVLCCK